MKPRHEYPRDGVDFQSPPMEIFDNVIQDYVYHLSQKLKAPPNYVLAGVLTAVSIKCKDSVLVVQEGQREYGNLYFALVGVPGTAKSAAINIPMRPITDRLSAENDDYVARKIEWENNLLEAKKHGSPKDVKLLELEPPKRPVDPITTEGTVEGVIGALAKLYEAQQTPFMVKIADELIKMIGDLDRYGGGGGDKATWLTLFNGGTVKRTLAKETIVAERARLSLIGGIQPKIMKEALNDTGDGFLDRFLFAVNEGAPRAGDYTTDIPRSAIEDYHELISNSGEAMKEIVLGIEQRLILEKAAQALEKKGTENQTGSFKKWEIYISKLYINLAYLFGDTEASTDTMIAAIRLANHYADQWIICRQRNSDLAMNEIEAWILEKLYSLGKAEPYMSLSKLKNSREGRNYGAEAVMETIEDLESRDAIYRTSTRRIGADGKKKMSSCSIGLVARRTLEER